MSRYVLAWACPAKLRSDPQAGLSESRQRVRRPSHLTVTVMIIMMMIMMMMIMIIMHWHDSSLAA